MRFTNLLKSIILEAQEKIDFLIDTYAKSKKKKDGSIKKAKLTPKELSILVAADPETNLHNVEIPTSDVKELAKVKAGPYSPWIIKRYLELNQNTEIRRLFLFHKANTDPLMFFDWHHNDQHASQY